MSEGEPRGPLAAVVRFCLDRPLVVALLLAGGLFWGLRVAPFDRSFGGMLRDPVPVDAIPDLGENQQIVFTAWSGRSPRDVEDQITYPLSSALLGVAGVRSVRSYSMLGFSSIYVIFREDVDFYWSRSRLLEKIDALPPGTLPADVRPRLGPDATGMGQIFWYTLEGLGADGEPTGGWDLDELRSVQDWHVRYALQGVEGVAEVASIGGHVREIHVDVDPDALRAHGVTLDQVVAALRASNVDVSARTVEANGVEYVIRGLGLIRSLRDVEDTVVAVRDHTPLFVRNVARVVEGPAPRRGALDKEGAEAVGGVVVARTGTNPLEVLERLKRRIAEIGPSLPRKDLPDGSESRLTIVPFYDRTGLIRETLGTLERALSDEIIVTVLVILLMLFHVRSSLLVSGLLPVAVLLCFVAMKTFSVDANVVALSGIAIAIGTMVDMAIVLVENVLRSLDEAPPDRSTRSVVLEASVEVGGAVLTAVATTVVSFLPVFVMEGAEGKLFRPLAFTKTFALLASIVVALTVLPPLAAFLLGGARTGDSLWGRLDFRRAGSWGRLDFRRAGSWGRRFRGLVLVGIILALLRILTVHWLPLGPERSLWQNGLFVGVIVGGLLGGFALFAACYESLLRFCLAHKVLFLVLPLAVVMAGVWIWSGLGKEFMPPLDEGSFLYMPTIMPHGSIGEALDVLQIQDRAMATLPEVASVVGKIGRVESALDPAPVSMIETVVHYHPEYLSDSAGRRLRFRWSPDGSDLVRDEKGRPVVAADGKPYRVAGRFLRDDEGRLRPDEDGRPFRLWRPPLDPSLNPGRDGWGGIRSADEIWTALVEAAAVPGSTSAPKLQPIATRIVMLQSGMRAPMGLKVSGPDLESLETAALRLEAQLKKVPAIDAATVNADRVVGKPYVEIDVDRRAIARFGLSVEAVQKTIETAVGGRRVTTIVEGRERNAVRVRYMRELRDRLDLLERVLVPGHDGTPVPLGQLAEIRYRRGPQVIKSEDGFPVAYVVFDGASDRAEVDVVEEARDMLEAARRGGELVLPDGVSYRFAGSYENQVRAERKLAFILPLALGLILVILHLHFGRLSTSLMVFSGVAVAWGGGFLLIGAYGQPWFMDFSVFGVSLRELFQVGPVNLSVAVWVGFLALFGIATDDGVVMATYLDERFDKDRPTGVAAIREATVTAAKRRLRPCLMTTATTLLALLPVLSSTGRGAEVMVPMAIPTFGGMAVELLTMLVVPVLWCGLREFGSGDEPV